MDENDWQNKQGRAAKRRERERNCMDVKNKEKIHLYIFIIVHDVLRKRLDVIQH